MIYLYKATITWISIYIFCLQRFSSILELTAEMTCLSFKFITVKSVLSGHSKRRSIIGFQDEYRLMQVKNLQNDTRDHSAIFSTFIKLQFVFKTFVLSFWSGRIRF